MNSELRKIALDTVEITEEGHYFYDGEIVSIMEEQEKAEKETITAYSVDKQFLTAKYSTKLHFLNTTTLDAAKDYSGEVVALNFASATHPGGGFLNGAQAQEESLCRSSGLYMTIKDSEAYFLNKSNPLYEDFYIYSPDVPVFKDDNGRLLEKPWLCSFITSPAINMGRAARTDISLIEKTMQRRIDAVLNLGIKEKNIVLGAWGCGAFRNDPYTIAKLFKNSIENYDGLYENIIFAITNKNQLTIFEKTIK